MRWTQEQLTAYELRNRPAIRQPSPDDAVLRESDLHGQIVDYCKGQFPKWKFRRARMDVKTTEEKGVEDFTIFASDNRTFHFECKARGKKRTTEQLSWALEMQLIGHEVHCIESFSEFLNVISTAAIPS